MKNDYKDQDYVMKPLEDRVFLVPYIPDERPGEIVIPDEFKVKKLAQVLAVGPQVHPDDLKAGDIVYLGEATGGSIQEVRGKRIIVMRFENIPAVVTEV